MIGHFAGNNWVSYEYTGLSKSLYIEDWHEQAPKPFSVPIGSAPTTVEVSVFGADDTHYLTHTYTSHLGSGQYQWKKND